MKAKTPLTRRLKVSPGEPLLLRCHTVFDTGKRPMEFAEVHYVSARFYPLARLEGSSMILAADFGGTTIKLGLVPRGTNFVARPA